jgi:hypothetical protein
MQVEAYKKNEAIEIAKLELDTKCFNHWIEESIDDFFSIRKVELVKS